MLVDKFSCEIEDGCKVNLSSHALHYALWRNHGKEVVVDGLARE